MPLDSLNGFKVQLDPISYRILRGYLLGLMLIGASLIAIPTYLHWQERDRFEVAYQKQAEYLTVKYGIQPVFSDRYTCYLNTVHYRNQSFLHELLAQIPYVECEEETFESDIAKLNATFSPFHWALLFPGIAIIVLSAFGWIGLAKLNGKEGDTR